MAITLAANPLTQKTARLRRGERNKMKNDDIDLLCLTRYQIISYFENNKINTDCSSCGQRDAKWSIELPTEHEFAGLSFYGNPDLTNSIIRPFWGIPIVPLMCNNCGFLRLYSKKMIAQSLKAVENGIGNDEK